MDVRSFEDMVQNILENNENNEVPLVTAFYALNRIFRINQINENNENNENNEVPIRRLGTNDWFNFDEEIEEFIDIDDYDDDLDGESASGVSNNNNNNNSHECPICLETREKYYTLIPCGHVLCASCVHRIKKTRGKNTCFICRRKAKKILRIYL